MCIRVKRAGHTSGVVSAADRILFKNARRQAIFIVVLGGRSHALASAVLVGWTICSVMLSLGYFTVEEDEEETKRRVLSGEGPPTALLD